jgi:hypothetical protein
MVATTAVTVAALADRQVVPLEVKRAYAVTDLVPVAVPLTVYVPSPVPETVPAGLTGLTNHVKVDPAVPEAVNTTLVP